MAKAKITKDWDALWNEFTSSLDRWGTAFKSFQKASNEVQTKYAEVMKKALDESSSETMNKFIETWKKSMSKDGIDAFKQFGEDWQKAMNESGMDQFQTYGQMMKKFTQTWKDMWRN